MPKLLSRCKHEEFESNSALQIRNQKERRAENAKKLGHCKNFAGLQKFGNLQNFAGCKISQLAKLPLFATVHLLPLFTLLIVPSCCPFDLLTFVPLFGFLPILSPVIAFDFGSF